MDQPTLHKQIESLISLMICGFHLREYNKKFVKKERKKQRTELLKAWKLMDTIGQGEVKLHALAVRMNIFTIE